MKWDQFSRFYDWEFKLFCNEQQKDVRLWLKLAEKYGDPLLELACGSGRITLPLAQKGYQISAVDNSTAMLQILESNIANFNNIKVDNADMTDFNFKTKFSFAFISYSSFQQLLEKQEQIKCLNKIHSHLKINGILGLDIGTHICEGKDQLEYRHLYTAEYPLNRSTVSMFTSYKTDDRNRIRYWNDKYLEVYEDGNSQIFYNKIALKECDQAYMEELFAETGFELIALYGDFEFGEFNETSNNAIYLVKKSNN